VASAEAAPTGAAPGGVDRLLASRPTLGRTRLLCVDGPAGAGKTTLAGQVAEAVTARSRTVALVHMDDLYEGWGGLRSSGPTLHQQVLEPLERGVPGCYRRYDWHLEVYAEEHPVPVVDVLVVEGVGAWRSSYAELVTLLVWVEAPADLRLRRGLERDGAAAEPHWRAWSVDEAALHAKEETEAHADLVVDGTAGP
jgi:uridine kinase